MIRLKRLVLAAVVLAALVVAPTVWLHFTSDGHVHRAGDDVSAPVAVVFGAQLAPGGTRPKPFLRGRLDTAAELVRAGKARAVLVSGDAHGTSGNEIAAMTAYLVDHGVPAGRIVGDGDGLDSYDTCRRARDVYGIRKALLVSQRFHLPRAVALCRSLGVDADGVAARCDDCRASTLASNRAREVPAAWKAALDRVRDRPPAVVSSPDPGSARCCATRRDLIDAGPSRRPGPVDQPAPVSAGVPSGPATTRSRPRRLAS